MERELEQERVTIMAIPQILGDPVRGGGTPLGGGTLCWELSVSSFVRIDFGCFRAFRTLTESARLPSAGRRRISCHAGSSRHRLTREPRLSPPHSPPGSAGEILGKITFSPIFSDSHFQKESPNIWMHENLDTRVIMKHPGVVSGVDLQ